MPRNPTKPEEKLAKFFHDKYIDDDKKIPFFNKKKNYQPKIINPIYHAIKDKDPKLLEKISSIFRSSTDDVTMYQILAYFLYKNYPEMRKNYFGKFSLPEAHRSPEAPRQRTPPAPPAPPPLPPLPRRSRSREATPSPQREATPSPQPRRSRSREATPQPRSRSREATPPQPRSRSREVTPPRRSRSREVSPSQRLESKRPSVVVRNYRKKPMDLIMYAINDEMGFDSNVATFTKVNDVLTTYAKHKVAELQQETKISEKFATKRNQIIKLLNDLPKILRNLANTIYIDIDTTSPNQDYHYLVLCVKRQSFIKWFYIFNIYDDETTEPSKALFFQLKSVYECWRNSTSLHDSEGECGIHPLLEKSEMYFPALKQAELARPIEGVYDIGNDDISNPFKWDDNDVFLKMYDKVTYNLVEESKDNFELAEVVLNDTFRYSSYNLRMKLIQKFYLPPPEFLSEISKTAREL